MRCKVCESNVVPVYSIDGDSELITGCCEDFTHILHARITSKGIGPHNAKPNTRKSKGSNSKIFTPLTESQPSNVLLEKAIDSYERPLVAIYIGTLENGKQYALLICDSLEWVNVLTYNRAKEPVYKEYGFSIKVYRWSYGSKVLGAAQIREVIKNNLTEIEEIMASQECVSQEARNYTAERSKRKATQNALIQEKPPANSYVCSECDFKINKDEFEESNLFCPDCGSPLGET